MTGTTYRDTYQIIKELGHGGKGVVYLANHLRLKRQVVLKMEKVSSRSREAASREVDVLKLLKHQYIPVVYDYFADGDRAVTVMDYIKGESLDKPLKRGEIFPQAQVIEWAKELLQALDYLHSPTHGDPPKGYVHSDIKPANIMRLPDNSICLIDFNIALSLGEFHVLGLSSAYASPEHFGFDFSGSSPVVGDNGIISGSFDNSAAADNAQESSANAPQAAQENAAPQNNNGGYANYAQSGDSGSEDATEETSDVQSSRAAGTADEQSTVGSEYVSSENNYEGEETRAAGESSVTAAAADSAPKESVSASRSSGSTFSTAASKKPKKIIPDVRSDIYCLGVTLYYLLTGENPRLNYRSRPESIKDFDIVPLSPEKFSKPFADIITKSINANPDLRFQSAAEMLEALENLKINDPRTKRLRLAQRICGAAFGSLLALGLFTGFVGLKRIQLYDNALKNAEYSQNALESGDIKNAVSYALEGLPSKNPLFNPVYLAEPQKALADALGVYELSDSYKSAATVALPSAPLLMRLSDDGDTCACVCAGKLEIISTANGSIIAELDADPSALSEVEFLSGSRLVFAGAEGLTCYDYSAGKTIWTGEKATGIAVSGDGKTVAGIYRDESVVTLYNAESGAALSNRLKFGSAHQYVPDHDNYINPGINLLELNGDGTEIALSFSEGNVVYMNLKNGEYGMAIPYSDLRFFSGGFIDDYFAVSGSNADEFEIDVFEYADNKNVLRATEAGGHGAVDLKIIGGNIYFRKSNMIYRLDQKDRYSQQKLVSADENIKVFDTDGSHIIAGGEGFADIYSLDGEKLASFEGNADRNLACMRNGTAVFGNNNSSELRVLRFSRDVQNTVATYPTGYQHSESRLSADKKYLMQFSTAGFRILDMAGNVLCDKELPDPDGIYDTQYRRNEKGSYLEVTYKSGRVVCYDSAAGDITEEYTTDPPSEANYTVHNVGGYRIGSPLNGNIEFFDEKTGKKLGEWVKEGILAYAYSVGDHIVLMLTSKEGRTAGFYGVVLDSEFKQVAYVPNICDVIGDELMTDQSTGVIKCAKLYSAEELKSLAEIKLKEYG